MIKKWQQFNEELNTWTYRNAAQKLKKMGHKQRGERLVSHSEDMRVRESEKKYGIGVLESNQDVDSICKKYGIRNYTINDDGSIDVDGDVFLNNLNLSKIPLKFRNVTGHFYCYNNQLTTLEGCPKSVVGHFLCSRNQLTTLEGNPQSVGGNFYCYNNQLTSLEGGPKSVGRNFNCYNNQLTTLEGCPQSVGGDFHCDNNKLTTLEGGPKSVGGHFYCSHNQIKDFRGFPEFWEGDIDFDLNPVQKILNEFPSELWCKVIYWINEYDAIDNYGNVIEDRLEEVKYQLGI